MYTVQFTTAYGREAVKSESWQTWETGLDDFHAKREADRVFLYEFSCRQSIVINEKTGKIVRRFGRDDRGNVKQIGRR